MSPGFLRSGLNIMPRINVLADQDPSDPYVFGPPDPDPDLLGRGMDPAPDPSVTKQK